MESVSVIDRDWNEFEQDDLGRLFSLSPAERRRFVFRGMPDATWEVQPTIDRGRSFSSATERDARLGEFIEEFKFQMIGLPFPLGIPKNASQWEFLARHHGLPSAILDWTESPHVAAFFAFAPRPLTPTTHVGIWCLDRNVVASNKSASSLLTFSDEYADFEFNPRAVEQDAVLLRVNEPVDHLARHIPTALSCFRFPIAARPGVLTRLSSMRITHRMLFRDLEAAAKTAVYSVEGFGP